MKNKRMKKKQTKCKHKWQIEEVKNSSNNPALLHIEWVAICTKCLEKRYI